MTGGYRRYSNYNGILVWYVKVKPIFSRIMLTLIFNISFINIS